MPNASLALTADALLFRRARIAAAAAARAHANRAAEPGRMARRLPAVLALHVLDVIERTEAFAARVGADVEAAQFRAVERKRTLVVHARAQLKAGRHALVLRRAIGRHAGALLVADRLHLANADVVPEGVAAIRVGHADLRGALV